MTSIDFGNNFDTTSVIDMSYMFYYFGYKSLESLDLRADSDATEEQKTAMFNTRNVTNMSYMFSYCGHNSMESINFGDNFNTTSVKDMQHMFDYFARLSMTKLDLCPSENATEEQKATMFNTSNVTDMKYMFNYTGSSGMTEFCIGINFDTSSVTNMQRMFYGFGMSELKSLDLGEKFDTSSVTSFNNMFAYTAYNMKRLDLGDKFYTAQATNMSSMFVSTGYAGMVELDLGPAFTKITSNFMNDAVGKATCIYYVPESIYAGTTNFKLSATDSTTVSFSSRKKLIPIYRPEWVKDTVTLDEENKKITISIKGTSYKTETVKIHGENEERVAYTSNVTPSEQLADILEDIRVFIDGTDVTDLTNPTITPISEATTSTNETTGKTEIVGYTVELSNLEQLARQDGIPFKEWSGNISLKVDGRGESTDTYSKNVLVDEYGNQSMSEIQESGTWINVVVKDGEVTENTENTMFTDFIKPEFTYKHSTGDINYRDKELKVTFDVTDEYFKETQLANDEDGELITVAMLDDATSDVNENVTKTLTKTAIFVMNKETKVISTKVASYAVKSTEQKVGERYELIISNLEQDPNDGSKYSGPISITFGAGIVTDNSNNGNDTKIITIGRDEPDGTQDPEIVDVVNPIFEKIGELSSINSSNRIDRNLETETGTVTVYVKGIDKYLLNGTLANSDITAKVIKSDGEIVTPSTISATVTKESQDDTTIIYKIVLSNFEANQGITSITIPAGKIEDAYGNKNELTEILVGNTTWTETGDNSTTPEYPAFRESIVDFTRPVWEYGDSSITRNREGQVGTVTVKILGSDNYYLKDTLSTDDILVYVNNTEDPEQPVTTITKSLTKITNEEELNGADTGYTLTLGNFGTYDGQVKIKIAQNSMKDTSGIGNKDTEILVGNPNWIETDEPLTDEDYPKYDAFRDSIVDFIKPVITYRPEDLVIEDKEVTVVFDVTDTNFLESNIAIEENIKIFVDEMQVYGEGVNDSAKITAELSSTNIPDGSANGLRYTLKLSDFELPENLEDEIFRRHSGIIEIEIAKDLVEDTSGNKNNETTITVDENVDFINPKITYVDKYVSWDQRYAEITVKATDRFYDFTTKLKPEHIKLYQQNLAGEYIEITNLTQSDIKITSVENEYGYDFKIRINNFEEEYKMKLVILADSISDTEGNKNDLEEIELIIDNKKPVWKYVSSDTSAFETSGTISFEVKGQDKFLNLTDSDLTSANIKVYKDGVDITDVNNITVTHLDKDENTLAIKSKSYKIDVTGLTDVATYTLALAKDTLIDEFENQNNTTTITFSKSAIASNTDNYTNITYYASPDYETTHQAYVHELMSVNTTGTNYETITYRPSTVGEIYNDSKNTLFAEPFTYENGTQTAYSFAGWAEANEKGFVKYYTDNTYTTLSTTQTEFVKLYGIYDEIPNTITNLKAAWQQATVVFVSDGEGDNSDDGLSPDTAVKDLETAFSKLNASGTTATNIIVIMDEVEWDGSTTFDKNATITSLYAGVDYESQGAELKISSNFVTNADIAFDNIKLYADSTTVSNGSDYLAKGTYTNMLITNYGDITLGRGITTPEDKFTFGAVVGGNFGTEAKTGNIGIHKLIVEAGRYNNIIAGSTLTTQTTTKKYIKHEVVIGNMKDAAVSRNDKLTITGYLAMGEMEDANYAFNTDGSQSADTAYGRTYADVTLLSGTFTGANKFAKVSENAGIYLRPIDGLAEGKVEFNMYGGNVNANIYGGSRLASGNTNEILNIMNFYGGQVNSNVFGHGNNNTSYGSSLINLEGRFAITGNIFGGSNATTIGRGTITGNTNIVINSSSISINGNIYGGSNGLISGTDVDISNGNIIGDTNITLKAGTIPGDIYGSGYNCGNSKATNITIENGIVQGTIYGGAYQSQVRTTANITILGGTVNSIYGGNVNTVESQLTSDTYQHNVNITIGNTEDAITPTVNGVIYGGGKYDKVGTAEIHLIECANAITVYGGSDGQGETATSNIYLSGMTVNEIYGGPKTAGTVTNSNIYLQSGTATSVYGGGYGGTTTNSNITLEGTATATNIYGGPNTSGTVTTSNVTLKSGTATNVFGGGSSADVTTSNVTLDGLTIEEIHGGSKDAGTTTNANVILKSGTVDNVYGGGYGGTTTNSNVTFDEASTANVTNVYGGNKLLGTTRFANINIQGTARVTGKLYGGGYKSAIGSEGEVGSTTINIAGGTIEGDINGGSEQGVVYGDTDIKIGKEIASSSLTAGAITIEGAIYGAGSLSQDTDISVYGETHITMINSEESPITFNGSIYGAGNKSNYSNNTNGSTIRIEDFGTSTQAYRMASIEKTDKVYIGNSYLELVGTPYTLNEVTNGLTVYENTTLYTKNGFNKVGGFNSLVTMTGSKAQVTFEEDGTITRNVDNRLYTLEGTNLIFAKQDGDLSNKADQDIWGDVNGMTFFGMYTERPTGEKVYDIYAPNYDYATGTVQNLFTTGTLVEGRHKANHNTSVDGFYTNIVDDSDEENVTVSAEYIDTIDYGTYYDWIAGAETIDYETTVIASTYSTYSVAEISLDKLYGPETTYTLSSVSLNALNKDIQLIDKLLVPTISIEDANDIFALTMETDKTGWLNSGRADIYGTATDNYGTFGGTTKYKTDTTNAPGKLLFRVYNSVNISEEKDVGNVIVKLIGTSKSGETFIVSISVNIKTMIEVGNSQYEPSFAGSVEKEQKYTTDSKVELSYLLYNEEAVANPYGPGDYRVLSSSMKLPAGTKLTMKDYGQGDNLNKIYYYHVTGNASEYEVEDGRYIYKLSNFIEMGSTSSTDKYVDDGSIYYHSNEGLAFEKFDISIDFADSNITTNTLEQDMYLQLRTSSNSVKFDNDGAEIKYSLYTNKNAQMSLSIDNANSTYAVVESIEIPFKLDASILEQAGIKDTKYYDKIAGIAIDVVEAFEDGYGSRAKSPELQNFKLINVDDPTKVYSEDAKGVIRVPMIEGLGTISGNYKITLTQANVPAGNYKVRVYFFTADDGKHFGGEQYLEKEFNVTFINKLMGTTGVEATDDSRILNTTTGLNLEGNEGLDMTVSIGDPLEVTNIRLELYKRMPTYTIVQPDDDSEPTITYTGTVYERVDLANYLGEDWEIPEDVGLTTEPGTTEYMFVDRDDFDATQELVQIQFERAIKEGIDTGEYKLVFKAYQEDTLVQTVRKTFIVTQ